MKTGNKLVCYCCGTVLGDAFTLVYYRGQQDRVFTMHDAHIEKIDNEFGDLVVLPIVKRMPVVVKTDSSIVIS